jgi:hypothetical protein
MPPLQAGLLAVAVVLLAVLVAAAGRAVSPAGSGPAPAPEVGAAVLRAALILVVLGQAAVFAILVWVIWPSEGRRRRHRPGSWLVAAASFLQTATLIVAAWLLIHFHPFGQAGGGGGLTVLLAGLQPAFPQTSVRPPAATNSFEWITVAIVAVVLLAGGRLLLAGRLRRRSPLRRLAEQVDAAIADSLQELELEADPRQAVIAAYARMVASLGAAGVPRQPHETAHEYLDRTLTGLGIEARSARRLTELFQFAKFSDHPVDEGMKRAAVEALGAVRDELRQLPASAASAARMAPA